MLFLLNQQGESTTSEALSFMTGAVERVFCLEPPPAQRRFKIMINQEVPRTVLVISRVMTLDK